MRLETMRPLAHASSPPGAQGSAGDCWLRLVCLGCRKGETQGAAQAITRALVLAPCHAIVQAYICGRCSLDGAAEERERDHSLRSAPKWESEIAPRLRRAIDPCERASHKHMVKTREEGARLASAQMGCAA